SGAAGTPGAAGTSGSSGTSGAAGSPGAAGTSGSSGSSGSSGTSGAAGTSGSSGTSGAAGSPGPPGDQGIPGTSGSSGTSGAAGTSGTSGSAGSSGTSGSGSGIYGEMYFGYNAVTPITTSALNGAWVGFEDATQGELSNVGFTNSGPGLPDTLNINTDGKYKIDVAISYKLNSTSTLYEIAIFTGGSPIARLHGAFLNTYAEDINIAPLTAIVSLSNGATIDLRFTAPGSDTLTFYHIDINILKVD
ncbi:MAG: hypothetical protein NUV97_03490, partial [archaeon]|nr:hypothetical protein [archaeon]